MNIKLFIHRARLKLNSSSQSLQLKYGSKNHHLIATLNFNLFLLEMQETGRVAKRAEKMNNIRRTLGKMPLFANNTKQLGLKMKEGKIFMTLNEGRGTTQDEQKQIASPNSKNLIVFQDRYRLGDKIGEGAHGIVKKCYDKQTGQLFAVKTIRLDPQHILFLKRNFTDIKQLKHRYIIGYRSLFLQMGKQTCHLVMEYIPFPDLLHAAIQSQQQLKQIVYQVLQALTFIHSKNVCHRDIKPQNILYDAATKTVKIIDFGISRKLTNRARKVDMLTITGTLYYRAPQMFTGGGYDQRVDLWALGVTIFKLMAGFTPFESPYHNETIKNIVKGQFIFPPEFEAKYSKGLRNFVSRLLRHRQQRLTANQALLDIWLIDLYQSADEITRSLTLNGRLLRMFGHSSFKTSCQPLLRTTTLKQNKSADYPPKLARQHLQQLFEEQQDSKIYTCDEDIRSYSP